MGSIALGWFWFCSLIFLVFRVAPSSLLNQHSPPYLGTSEFRSPTPNNTSSQPLFFLSDHRLGPRPVLLPGCLCCPYVPPPQPFSAYCPPFFPFLPSPFAL